MAGGLDDANRARVSRSGFRPLPDDEALSHLDTALHARQDTALQASQPVLMPARLDHAALRDLASAGLLPAPLHGLVSTRTDGTGTAAADTAAPLLEELTRMSPGERETAVLDLVRAELGTVLGRTPQSIDPERGLLDQGIDSLTALEMRNRLSGASGLQLPKTLVFDHPTPAALARHLLDELAPDEDAAGQLTAEFERFEAAIGALARDGDSRTEVHAFLQTLLSKWSNGTQANGAAKETDITDRIDSASDEEMFDLIDKELN
jgi:aryl carrier-like protein